MAAQELGALSDALERLIGSRQVLVDRISTLRVEVQTRDQKITGLENEIRELRQTKRDVAKRIDGLIAQLDHLESSSEQGVSAPAKV